MQQDRVYRLEQGLRVAKIYGVQIDKGQPFLAGVRYEDGTSEMVPTMVVAERYPQMMRAFYEARIHFAGKQVPFEELIARDQAKLAKERDKTMTEAKSDDRT